MRALGIWAALCLSTTAALAQPAEELRDVMASIARLRERYGGLPAELESELRDIAGSIAIEGARRRDEGARLFASGLAPPASRRPVTRSTSATSRREPSRRSAKTG